MNCKIHTLISVLGIFFVQNVFSQDVSRFSSDENKFSVGFQLSGAFPVGSFNNADISFPCNSSVYTGSAFEFSLGYKINANWGGTLLLSESLYELDPSVSGVAQLLNTSPGLYENASVFKSGQLTAQSALIGASYNLPLNKSNKIALKSHLLIGIIACTIPEIEISGEHIPAPADKNGNSIDTAETWDAPRTYSYFFSYRFGTGVYYSLNHWFSVFVNVDYQGSNLIFTNLPFTYNLSVYSNNSAAGTSNTVSNSIVIKEVNPTIFYRAILVGLGCEIRF